MDTKNKKDMQGKPVTGEDLDQIRQGLERMLAKEINGFSPSESVIVLDKKEWSHNGVNEDFCDDFEENDCDDLDMLNDIEPERTDTIWEENKQTDRKEHPDSGETKSGKKKRRKKKSFLRRMLGKLVALLLVFCIVAGLLWYGLVGKCYSAMQYSPVESVAMEAMKEDGVTNILLIGNDSRKAGEDGRSDAMILLSISSRTDAIVMLSLMRDMYVEIPGYKDNRLNAAYALGGAELLMETLEHNLGIEVHRFVQVNFQAFAGLVDAVGGVDLELSNEEVQYVNGYLTEYNVLENRPEGTDYLDSGAYGMLHLNGPQALAYCRIRYIGSDFARTQRQRDVLMAVMKKAPKTVLTNLDGLLDGLLPNLTTNLTEAECRTLSLEIINLLRYDLEQSRIPVDGSYTNAKIDGKSVLKVDFEANRAFIRRVLYGE